VGVESFRGLAACDMSGNSLENPGIYKINTIKYVAIEHKKLWSFGVRRGTSVVFITQGIKKRDYYIIFMADIIVLHSFACALQVVRQKTRLTTFYPRHKRTSLVAKYRFLGSLEDCVWKRRAGF
jgi:hypothetical protein